MKYLLIALITTSFFIGCDKVEFPVEGTITNEGDTLTYGMDTTLYPGNWSSYTIPTFGENTNTNRNILIEDFTGHHCGNCPLAGAELEDVKANYPNRIVGLAVHAGAAGNQGISPFQEWNEPSHPNYPKYNRNFTNQNGIDLAIAFDLQANPTGTVNRYTIGSSVLTPHTTWANIADTAISNNILAIDIQVDASFYPATNGLFVHVETEHKIAMSRNLNIVVALKEKEVIDWQLDYSQSPEDVEFYHHHDVHLGNVNTTYGRQITSTDSTTAVGTKVLKHYSYAAPTTIVDNTNLAVVAYVMDADTYEVLQVIEKDL